MITAPVTLQLLRLQVNLCSWKRLVFMGGDCACSVCEPTNTFFYKINTELKVSTRHLVLLCSVLFSTKTPLLIYFKHVRSRRCMWLSTCTACAPFKSNLQWVQRVGALRWCGIMCTVFRCLKVWRLSKLEFLRHFDARGRQLPTAGTCNASAVSIQATLSAAGPNQAWLPLVRNANVKNLATLHESVCCHQLSYSITFLSFSHTNLLIPIAWYFRKCGLYCVKLMHYCTYIHSKWNCNIRLKVSI